MKTRAQKEQTIQELEDKLSRAKSVVFADYQGLTMSQLAEIRSKLAESGATFSVTKNTLLERALKNQKLAISDDKMFEGPIATLFAYEDEITPIKVLTKGLKDFQIGKVKAGLLNGEALDAASINKLASLPSREELLGKVVGTLGAPLYGLAGVLQALPRNLVYALDQIRISKGGE